jgi:ABC-type multidrug transport system fused ATPase/permease subunit
VDYETDTIIQKCMREEFKEATILTIAHRLNTIADYDRVLVLKEGEIAELDSPAALLKQPQGIFRSMVLETGPSNAEWIEEVAQKRQQPTA